MLSNNIRVKILLVPILIVGLFACMDVEAAIVSPFKIWVKTDNTGSSANNQFTIPTTGTGYDYDVDCHSDGVYEVTNQTGNYTCAYGSTGYYAISIRGPFPRIFFNDTGDKLKLIEIKDWGSGVWSSMEYAFYGCSNLTVTSAYNPNLSNVEDMGYMFAKCTNFNHPVGDWDVSNVVYMNSLFYYAESFNKPLENWDVSNVYNMSYMFYFAKSFDQSLENWDVSYVSYMNNTFGGAEQFNKPLGNWDVSNVTSMSGMFALTDQFNQDLDNWDVSNVTNMLGMFRYADTFNQDIGGWNVSNITSMQDIFEGTALSVSHYDALLIEWEKQALENGVSFHSGSSNYCNGETARSSIISDHSWIFTDLGGKDCSFYFESPNTMSVSSGKTEVGVVEVNTGSATYSIVGVADGDKFTITSPGGILSFITAPDYAHPTDANGDNVYRVQIKAVSGIFEDIQTISVRVKNSAALVPIVNYLLD